MATQTMTKDPNKKKVGESGYIRMMPVSESERLGLLACGKEVANLRVIIRKAEVFRTRYVKYPTTFTAVMVFWLDVFKNKYDNEYGFEGHRSICYHLFMSRENKKNKYTWNEYSSKIPEFLDGNVYVDAIKWEAEQWERVVDDALEHKIRSIYEEQPLIKEYLPSQDGPKIGFREYSFLDSIKKVWKEEKEKERRKKQNAKK